MNSKLHFLALFVLIMVLGACKEDNQTNTDTEISLDYSANIIDSDGNTMVNSIVELYNSDNSKIIKSDTTDENGNIDISVITEFSDNLEISVIHPLSKPYKINLNKIDDKIGHIITLEDKDDCCGSAELVIKDNDGNPLEGVEIKVRQNMKVLKNGKSDKVGEITFSGLCLDEYEFRLAKDGYKVIEKLVAIENCDDAVKLNFEMEAIEKGDCCNGVVKVIVKDKDNNLLINKTVRLWKGSTKLKEVKTNLDGFIEFTDLCEGNDYSISIISENFEAYEFDFDLDCNKELIFEKTLKPTTDCCDAILKFIVKDSKTKEILKDAKITLRLDGKVIFENRVTNADGEVNEGGLCKGKYTIIIKRDGYKTIETYWNVEKCDELQEDFWMESDNDDCCQGVLIFKPKNKNGDNLNGTKVFIYKDGKIIQDPVVKDGKAIEDNLCEGKYTIVYKREGYKNKEVLVELGCNEEKTIEHTLEVNEEDCCLGFVRVKVKDENGNYLTNTTVRLWKGSNKLNEAKTDANGFVEFEKLCEGNDYSISIISAEHENLEFEFDLDCNKELTFEKNLKTTNDCCDATLKFIVKDNNTKEVIKDAKITLKLDGKVIFEKKVTDNEGEYLAKELCKGKYTVIIEKDGFNRIETSWNVEKCDDFQEHFWLNK